MRKKEMGPDVIESNSWKRLLEIKSARWAIVFCILCIPVMVFVLPLFYGDVIQPKQGVYLNDFFLHLFTPVNWSVLIFSLIYITILQTVISVAKNPGLILSGVTLYFMVSLIRMLTMYLWTLEPPLDMILLIDPVSATFYPTNTFAKDMFFSGHVSTMMVLVLIESNRMVRIVKIGITILIGILLAWQHVHYTVDLLVAPIVTYAVFYLLKKFQWSNITT